MAAFHLAIGSWDMSVLSHTISLCNISRSNGIEVFMLRQEDLSNVSWIVSGDAHDHAVMSVGELMSIAQRKYGGVQGFERAIKKKWKSHVVWAWALVTGIAPPLTNGDGFYVEACTPTGTGYKPKQPGNWISPPYAYSLVSKAVWSQDQRRLMFWRCELCEDFFCYAPRVCPTQVGWFQTCQSCKEEADRQASFDFDDDDETCE